MQLIPVIDIKDGVVVHAKYGQRDTYQPIESVLSAHCDVYSVIEGFLSLHAFDVLYLADLNAITQCGDNNALIDQIVNDFPRITFWIDAGSITPQVFPRNYLPVLGSESLPDNDTAYLALFRDRFVLSLDYAANGEKLGATSLWQQPALWPQHVIIMTLATVGSAKGVALDILDYFCLHYPHQQFIAAGGVRGSEDIAQLKSRNIKAVLLASALHSGAIKADDIQR